MKRLKSELKPGPEHWETYQIVSAHYTPSFSFLIFTICHIGVHNASLRKIISSRKSEVSVKKNQHVKSLTLQTKILSTETLDISNK